MACIVCGAASGGLPVGKAKSAPKPCWGEEALFDFDHTTFTAILAQPSPGCPASAENSPAAKGGARAVDIALEFRGVAFAEHPPADRVE
jgi:hypothetical protein